MIYNGIDGCENHIDYISWLRRWKEKNSIETSRRTIHLKFLSPIYISSAISHITDNVLNGVENVIN